MAEFQPRKVLARLLSPLRTRGTGQPPGNRWDPHPLVLAAGLAALGVLHLYPLSLQPGVLAASRSTDVQELIWRLLWGVHALVTRPAGLMDANTFFPDEGTYTTMDYLVGVSVLAAPFRAFTSNPLLVYNLTAMASLALSAWGAYLLARSLTGSRAAACAGAAVFALNPVHTARLGQLNILAVHALPFLLLALHGLFAQTSFARMLIAAALLLVAFTSSGYQAVFASAAVAWAAVVLAAASPSTRWRALAATAGAVLIAAVLFAPLAWPYVAAAAEEGHTRSLREVQRHSPAATALVLQQSALHDAIRTLWDPDDRAVSRAGATLFPGVVVLALAAAGFAFWIGSGGRRSLAILYGGLAVCGFALSLGANLPGYATLFEWTPPLRLVRAPSRFSLLGLMGLAVLAAAGAAMICERLRERRPAAAWMAASLICLLHLAETWAPVGAPTLRYSPPPDVYRWLASQPGDFGIVELPSDPEQNTTALVYSTFHWKRLVNGYHGSFISRYHDELLFDILPRFPRPATIEALSAIEGLRYIVVHDNPVPEHFPLKHRYRRRQRLHDALEALPPTLRIVWRSDQAAVLELVEPEGGWTGIDVRRVANGSSLRGRTLNFEARWSESLLGPPGHAEVVVTLDHRELAHAPVDDRFRRFEFALPEHMSPGLHTIRIHVRGVAAPAQLAQHPELTIGRTGVATAAQIKAVSEDPDARGPARIEVNGHLEMGERPGYIVAVIDPALGQVQRRVSFNVGDGAHQADRMGAFLEDLPAGTVVAAASSGPIDGHCTTRMALALRDVGVKLDPCSGRYRTHAFVGVKGAPPGTAAEKGSATRRSLVVVGSEKASPRVAVRRLAITDASSR